ncbi:universal stress protein [Actinoplanes sp. NPDC049802]|uniref:universal stress protein n=1 Tax=Actinoplanes sp. NPDC049802 TaxID=3154742 RepID=UPI0033E23D8D
MTTEHGRVILGYDGSVPAAAAMEASARLLPRGRAYVTYLWTPPYASEPLRRRLWHGMAGVDDYVAAIEREGEAEAGRLAAMGVTLAAAHGWDAEPLVERSYGGEGAQLAQLAERTGAGLIVTGSRGLGGVRAIFGSVSDMVAHYAPCPVLAVPYPLLDVERAALDKGPVLIGWDGSAGAAAAHRVAERLFGTRTVVPAFVRDGDEPPGAAPEGLITLSRSGLPAEHGRAIALSLAAQARAEHAALIVVGSVGRSALSEIMLGSVAMATLHHAHRPVLLVPHRYDPAR